MNLHDDESPWNLPNEYGELPGDICCMRSGGRCYDHDPYRFIHTAKALVIEGWMTPEELKWLSQQAKIHKTIAEIGSYLGRSTRALGDNTSGIVYAFDDWYGPRDIQMTEEKRMSIWEQFNDNVGDLIAAKKVVPWRQSHESLTSVPMVDMVFIDGDHQYSSVKRDIEFWKQHVMPGGLLCGHDIDQEQVKKAVVDCIGGYDNPAGYIWAVCL